MAGATVYPHMCGLFIGVPASGRPVPIDWAYGFLNLHPPMNFNVHYGMVRGMPVDTAREMMAEAALKDKAKYLFFLGEDNTGPGFGLRQLIFDLEHNPTAMVAGGIYCHKAQPPMPMVFRGNGGGPYFDWKVGELFECSGLGMDFTVIRTEVFEHLKRPWFKTVDNIDGFYSGKPGGDMWTEDLYFCKKVTDAGFKIIADAGVLVDHWDMNPLPNGQMNPVPTGLPKCKPTIAMATSGKKIVDLGSGEDPLVTNEGTVVKVDIRESCNPDYRCDLRKLPFADGEFDVVYSSHTLEHFSREEVPGVLDEWVRLMNPDGELRLVLPNIEWAATKIKEGIVNEDVMNVLYGQQSYSENFHKFCFTPKVLEEMLKERGFKRMDFALDGYNIYCRAWKNPPKVVKKAPMGGKKPKKTNGKAN